jgi:formylglycine-generating enzyme required for sulfatase activity
MLAVAVASFWCLAVAAAPGAGSAVAVAPCIVGPGVSDALGSAVTQVVVTAVAELPGVRMVDRSLTAPLVREQDLTLVSRAAAVLPQRFGDLGAQQVLIATVLRLPSGFILSQRLVDVGSGEVLRSNLLEARAEERLLAECGARARGLWESAGAAPAGDTIPLDQTLAEMWQQLDQPEVRRLLGPDLDRVESVYRQYAKAAASKGAEEAERLARIAVIYLTDGLTLLQRALAPPEGMVYVPPGWVTLPTPAKGPRRFWVDGFFIDRCEYTQGRYAALLPTLGRRPPLGWSAPTAETAGLPVVGVDWYDAEAVALQRGMELPGYAQWMRAVGGEEPRKYPWGDVWRAEWCNFARDPRQPALEPAGSHPGGASGFGVLDGAGGVCEWLNTWYSADYWNQAPERNPPGPAEGAARLALGGSFRSDPNGCTCRSVEQLTPATRKDDLGFRCVLPLKPSARRAP